MGNKRDIMQFHGRGFYNTLMFSSSQAQEKWQIENYQPLSLETLLSRLKEKGLLLDPDLLKEYMRNADSPEDLTDILSENDEGTKEYESLYLIIFELWRRLAPEKESLSIFCDRLDHLIHDYDEGKPVADELVKALNETLKIFENHMASGLSQKQTYELFSSYLAQDLETFIYDFLCDLIEAGESTLAFELVFGFYEFLHDKPALDMLKSVINLFEDSEETQSLFFHVMEGLFDKKRYNLVLDAIYFTHDAELSKIAKTLATRLLSSAHGDEKLEILSLLEPIAEKLGLKL